MKPSQVMETIRESMKLVRDTHGKERPPALFIWGLPGIGKSSVVRQATELEKIGFLDTRLLHADPTDGKGIPDVKGDFAVWKKTEDIPTQKLVDAGRILEYGVWFLDEFNLAKPAVQGAFYQALLDHKLGLDDIAAGWLIVAAGNKKTEAYNVYELPAPCKNRFIHISFDLDFDEWETYALRNRFNSDIIAFHHSTGNKYLYNYDSNRVEDAFPTPRTWEFVSQIMKIYSGDKVRSLIRGAVGEGAETMLFQFMKHKEKLPSLDKILAGEDLIPTDPDILYLVISGLISRFSNEPKIAERVTEYSLKLDPTFMTFLVRSMIKVNLNAVRKTKSWKSFCDDYRDLLLC